MKPLRPILLLGIFAVVFAVGWLVWFRPHKIDMATYAPASALMYIETNEPLAVVQALVGTDAWKLIDKTGNADWVTTQSNLTKRFIGITGLGPIHSVLLTRAQIAIVVTDFGSVEDGDTLTVKPELALIIETHTSGSRIRNITEQALQKLADSAYENPTLRRTSIDGVEFLEWKNHSGSRQIVAAIVGSLIVVGNTEGGVQMCLNSAARRSPSLKDDANLQRLRSELAGKGSLTFGYVPQEKSARLLSLAVPLILGRAPGDVAFQKVVSTGAAKLLGSIAWSSKPFRNGIEDRYLISLQPSILRQLRPALSQIIWDNEKKRLLPENTFSATSYNFDDPSAAWEGLKTSVSSNVDALSAVVFSSLLKSALLSYGISEPEIFLRAVKGEILTLRMDANGEHTLLVAGIRNRETLRALLLKTMKVQDASQPIRDAEVFADEHGQIAFSLFSDVVIVGTLSDVRRYSEKVTRNEATKNEEQIRMTWFAPLSNLSPIVTYTDDSERVRRFISAVTAVSGLASEQPATFEPLLAQLPYAATETRLLDQGFERITRSPLGQFSTLLPLLIPSERRSTSPSR